METVPEHILQEIEEKLIRQASAGYDAVWIINSLSRYYSATCIEKVISDMIQRGEVCFIFHEGKEFFKSPFHFGDARSRIHANGNMLWEEVLELSRTPNYEDEIKPYLASFPDYWKGRVLRTFEKTPPLQVYASLFPFAFFGLFLSKEDLILLKEPGLPLDRVSRICVEKRVSRGATFQPLFEVEGLENLKSLNLGGTGMTDEELSALVKAPLMKGLTCLDLEFNYIGDDGVIALAASPLVSNLEELSLHGCGITSKGAQALIDSPHLGNLKRLGIEDNLLGTKVLFSRLGQRGE